MSTKKVPTRFRLAYVLWCDGDHQVLFRHFSTPQALVHWLRVVAKSSKYAPIHHVHSIAEV
jgi:hypothetical protein